MVEKLILELPEDLARQVRTLAAHTRRSVDEVLMDSMVKAPWPDVVDCLIHVLRSLAATAGESWEPYPLT